MEENKKIEKRIKEAMFYSAALVSLGLAACCGNSVYRNYKYNDLTYLEELIEHSTDSKRRAFRGTELEGLTSIKKISSFYEDAWICCDNKLWIDIGKKTENKEVKQGFMQAIQIDRNYIRKRSKNHKKILLAHPHYDIPGMTEQRALPNPFDTRLMIEISREYYKLNPEGDIKFAIVQQTFGTIYFYLTEKGKKGNLQLTKDETFKLYNQWYITLNTETPKDISGILLIDYYCKKLSTDEFKVEWNHF